MSTTSLPRRTAAFALALTLGAGLLAACGDDDEPTADDGTEQETGSPEDHKAPMEEVVAQLPTMREAGDAAAAAAAEGDFEAALAEYEELHEIWEEVEGTVKDTDLDAYEAIETAQGLIKDGAESEDAERVAQGAADQAEAVEAFLAANG